MVRHAWSRLFRNVSVAFALGLSGLTLQAAHAEKYAAIVVDADSGEVLHERFADDPRFPASLTKVMTLYLLFDAIEAGEISLTDTMKVSRTAANQPPSNLRLKTGDRISVSDAIAALTTKSANDVAVVIAERLSGSETRFARAMTTKAKQLGLYNTTFRNASGLPDPQQISTARDMAILAAALIDTHGDYYHYFGTERFSWGGLTYRTHNELLKTVEGVDGIKTGYTRASGFNLMTSATRDNRRVIAIMLGGNTAKSRNAHVADLVEAAFATFADPSLNPEPSLRPRIAFASVQTPLNPNAAAEPMLNGRRLSEFVAQGSAEGEVSELIASTDEESGIVEGDAVEPVQPAPPVAAYVPPPPPPFSVAAYEARQLGN